MTDVNGNNVRRVIELDFVAKKIISEKETVELESIKAIDSTIGQANALIYKDMLYLLITDKKGNTKIKIIDISLKEENKDKEEKSNKEK